MSTNPATIGERNGRAVLSDEDVDLMRDMFEHHWLDLKPTARVRLLAEKFEIHARTAWKIVCYERRANTPTV